MQAYLMFAVFTVAVVAVPDRQDPTPKQNTRPLAELLVGEWRVFKQVHGGTENTSTNFGVIFTPKTMQHVNNRQPGGTFPFTLDTTRSPATISFHASNEAIFKIEGDVLWICFSPSGTRQPPAQFVSPPGSGVTLWQGTRIKK